MGQVYRGLAGARHNEGVECPQCKGKGEVPGSPRERSWATCPLCGGFKRVDAEAACKAGWAGTGAPVVNAAAQRLLEDD